MVKTENHIKAVCIVSILAGVIASAVPSGKMKGAFSSFCAVAVIFYIVSPLADIKAESINLFAYDKADNEESLLTDVRTAEILLCEQMLENAVEEKLSKSVPNIAVKLFCEKQGDEIKVISADVTGCADEAEKQNVYKYLTDSFDGIEVSFEEGDGG